MTDLPIFRRDVLFKAFNGDPALVSAFEQLVQFVTDAAAEARNGAVAASVIAEASVLTLAAVEGLNGARVLTAGEGIALDAADGLVSVRVTDLVPKIDGGFAATFIVTGETNLILPLIGTLATLSDLATAVAGSVTSFNTRTGAVTLTSADVTGALTYTPTSVTGLTGAQTVAAFKTGLTLVKGDVGLGNVDNTADAAKVVLSASKLTTARNFTITGDGAWTVSFDGSADATAALTLATVNATTGSFGGAGKTLTATANAKGLITAIAETSIAITASQVTDFSEAADDRVAALIQNGTGITWSYNDAAGTLTPTVMITQYTDEMAQDAVGAMIDGTLVYVDGTPLLTRAALTGDATAAQGSNALALATVNSNVGTFGSITKAAIVTVNAKGLVTAASESTITPAVGSITGLGTGVATALAVNVGSAGAFVTFNGAGGTPSSLTLTNATGLPISTGVSGLGSNVATFLATPSSANLAAALTDETGSGANVFATNPTFADTTNTGKYLSTAAAGAANFQANQTTGSIADNGTYDFATQNYSFFFIVETQATAQAALCATDGGNVFIIWQSGALYTAVINTASHVNLYYSGGAPRIQNKRGGASTFSIINLKAVS